MFVQNISREITTFGGLTLRWYGLMFVIGLLINYFFTRWVFKREKYPLDYFDTVALFLFIGMVIGARLGHVFFYDASFYLSHPIEILKIWKGGLASHGAAIGLLVAYLLWIKFQHVKFTKYIDVLVLGMPITAGFVRIGNFFNSEILGKPTDGTWGIVFKKLGEDFPRYPTQFYEAGLSFGIFFILFWVYLKFYKKLPPMFIMFLYVFLYFLTRFIVEFWKERQAFTYDIPLSMGQWLSIIPVLLAVFYFVYIAVRKKKH
ncbi:prolipoprotein diacylglyceryl transferase [bacterium]|nr:prolipoprotein diacylglyceryl transferase [bacterium]